MRCDVMLCDAIEHQRLQGLAGTERSMNVALWLGVNV
jgi:hypothetical protein